MTSLLLLYDIVYRKCLISINDVGIALSAMVTMFLSIPILNHGF